MSTKQRGWVLIPWAVIQHEMARQLADLYADVPAEIPAALRAQPLDAIEAHRAVYASRPFE